MDALFLLIFAAVAAIAIAFAVWPLLRVRDKPLRARLGMAVALGLFVVGLSGGVYLLLGRPDLGERALAPTDNTNLDALVAVLAQEVEQRPGDIRGWTLLGQGYLTLNDPNEAAKAFSKALELANAQKKPQAALYSAYGEALVRQSGGTVPFEAQEAFRRALALDPKDNASLYYMGQAAAAHGKTQKALDLWERLLAEAPTNASWRLDVVDRIAALKAQTGDTPDISAMVAALAGRLKSQPNDPAGWRRLVRAYSVLGDRDKALAALRDGRKAMAGHADALTALSVEAKTLKLED